MPTAPAYAPVPASLAHFVLFNPTLSLRPPRPPPPPPPPQSADPTSTVTDETPKRPSEDPDSDPDSRSRDRDLEDDLREAAQIVFYTSRQAGGVSRDKMLRQVGLAKGLMGFADMVSKDAEREDEVAFWGVHSQRSRLIVFSPESDWYIYICVTLAQGAPTPGVGAGTSAAAGSSTPTPTTSRGEPAATAQGLSDRMLVDALRRGYDDFYLLYGSLSSHLPPTPAFSSLLDRFWTRFAFSFESTYLSSTIPHAHALSTHSPHSTSQSSPLSTWLGGSQPPPDTVAEGLDTILEVFSDDAGAPVGSEFGLVGRDGLLTSMQQGFNRTHPALIRFLVAALHAAMPPPLVVHVDVPKETARQGLGFGLRRKRPVSVAAPARSQSVGSGVGVGAGDGVAGEDLRKSSWTPFGALSSPLAWAGLGSTSASIASSRSSTPAPGDKPGSTLTAPATPLSVSSAAPVSPLPLSSALGTAQSSPPSSSTISRPSRWSTLGLGGLGTLGGLGALGLGDAVGNVSTAMGSVGVVLGLSPTPNKVEEEHGDTVVEPVAAVSKGETQDQELELEEGGGQQLGGVPETNDVKEPVGDYIESPGDNMTATLDDPVISQDVLDSVQANDPTVKVSADVAPGGREVPSVISPVDQTTLPSPVADQLTPDTTRSSSEVDPTPQLKPEPTPHHERVEQTPVAIPELEEAVRTDEVVEVVWESRTVWIEGIHRRVLWVIRDNLLVYVLFPDTIDTVPSPPASLSTSATLALYSKLPSVLSTESDGPRLSGDPRLVGGGGGGGDSTVYHCGQVTDKRGEIDSDQATILAEMRDVLETHPSMVEVYARTPQSKFVVAKRSRGGVEPDGPEPSELYLVVGRKEASLTDAEHSVRSFTRSRPEFT